VFIFKPSVLFLAQKLFSWCFCLSGIFLFRWLQMEWILP